MRCYQVLEEVKAGIPVVLGAGQEGHVCPYLPTPAGCSMRLLLDPQITSFIGSIPEQQVRLSDVHVEFGDGYILFKGRKMYRSMRDRQCLVHVVTAGGEGGKVRLTSNSYATRLKGSKVPEVQRVYDPFPDEGVLAFCTPEELERINAGVDYLDVLLVMHKGASFRIQRNGGLEGASPQLFVHWNGEDLSMNVPRRYVDDRVALLAAGLPAAAE
jgi:hypothetical protein